MIEGSLITFGIMISYVHMYLKLIAIAQSFPSQICELHV